MSLSQINSASEFLFNRYMLLGVNTFNHSLDIITKNLIEKDNPIMSNNTDSTTNTGIAGNTDIVNPNRPSELSPILNLPTIQGNTEISSSMTLDKLYSNYINSVIKETS